MTTLTLHPGSPLTGRCYVPGDKSISHRAVMFASIADGVSQIHNFLDGADCRATVDVMRALGVRIDVDSPTESRELHLEREITRGNREAFLCAPGTELRRDAAIEDSELEFEGA